MANQMDGLRSLWDMDITGAGFHEYGEQTLQPGTSTQTPSVNEMRTEVIKTYSLATEEKRSGKRSRHRAVVAVGNGAGKIGLGSMMHRDRKVAIEKARAVAEKNQIEVMLGCHPTTQGKCHTARKELIGFHDDLTIKISPAVRGTGIKASPMGVVFLKLAGIEDCEVFPESSRSDNSASMAFALFNALKDGNHLQTNNCRFVSTNCVGKKMILRQLRLIQENIVQSDKIMRCCHRYVFSQRSKFLCINCSSPFFSRRVVEQCLIDFRN